MKASVRLLSLLLLFSLLFSLLSCASTIERAARILEKEGFTVTYREENLHAHLSATLKATRPGEWLDIYVFKEKENAEAMYQSMLSSYEHLPNMVAVLEDTTVIHGHRTAYLLIEK